MRKHVYSLAESTQQQLRAAYAAHGDTWAAHVPRILLDTWAALWAWHAAGEPVTRLTDEAEDAILTRPLPASLPLEVAHTRRGAALGCIMPERSLWVILARLQARQRVTVHGGQVFAHRQPVLVYLRNDEAGGIGAGYYSLQDHPTLGSLSLRPGTLHRADGTALALGDSETADDDYRVLLALHSLYIPA